MRAFLCVLGLALLAAVPTASAAPNKTCLTCHTAPLFDAEAMAKSVHGKLECTDCHKGYDFALHRARPQEPVPALAQKLAGRSTAPTAVAACAGCHESALQDVTASVHGRWLREPNRPVAGPLCLDCHGAPHAIPAAKDQTALARKTTLAARCESCHEDAEMVKKAGLSAHAVPGFTDSAHGRLLKLGHERAPACQNCHGYHEITGAHTPASAVVGGANKVQTCAECHPGANQNFADTFTHEPLEKRPVPYWTIVGFSWLTTLTVIFLVGHMLLDFTAQMRAWLRRRRGLAPAEPPLPRGSVRRFDIHELVQHWMIIAAVVTLVITDWPIRAPQFIASEGWIAALGGIHTAQLIHRIAGVLLGAAGLYHLVYLTIYLVRYRWSEGGLFGLPMMFGPRDVIEVLQNLAHFFGLRKEKPKFAKYTYVEKFDYWAVFWGVAIMFGTGLVRWFPVWFARWMPADVLEAMQVAHGDEATLCVMALFVWHIYNVHISPRVFPMAWSWLDGRMGYHALREEHRGHFEELFPNGVPPEPPPAPQAKGKPLGGAPPKPAPAKKEDAP
jgi:cytochrome b subunit of formate dehydrogenase/nitrate/TMAO reductase-like tetraheme cytochrome c subunit